MNQPVNAAQDRPPLDAAMAAAASFADAGAPLAASPKASPESAVTSGAEMVQPPATVASLKHDRWQTREHRDPMHWVCLERGTPYEAVFDPGFWANVASKFRPMQVIYLTNDEMKIYARLLILDSGINFAVVAELEKHNVDELKRARPQPKQLAKYKVHFGGPIDGWRIIRESDQTVVARNIANEATAIAQHAELLRRLGNKA